MTDIGQLLSDANAAFRNGDYPKAAAFAQDVLKLHPKHYWAHLMVGDVAKKLGDSQTMLKAWRAAIDTADVSRLGAYRNLLQHQFSTMDFSEAGMLQDALELAKTSPQARWHKPALLFLAGCLALASGDTAEAEEQFNAAYPIATQAGTKFESEMFWPWVVEKLEEARLDGLFPCLTYMRKAADSRLSPINYLHELARLGNAATVVEIGAMDGVRWDPIHEFITGRGWAAVLVEPSQTNFDRLCSNYAGYQNAKCVRAAITDRSGEVTLYKFRPDAVAENAQGVASWAEGVSSMSRHMVELYPDLIETETVPAIPFDQLMAQNPLATIDVLQIDTEGHDWKILSQVDLLRWQVRVVHLELCWLSPTDRLSVFDKLEAAGYTYYFDKIDVTAIPSSQTRSAS